ncbi:hypothetical protein [Cytobacillus firmus]|uniref:hypothetical protein n=1 Tax=Cytobacillus firmus TaxID=1399 RepID=UPI00203006D0|nr:hypothetical protein [Cytobacillus firmus]URT72719.1 hypothetical protein NAF01_09835 [Cytobacillus firmus]
MSLKSRMNKLDKYLKPKGKDPKQEWREDMVRLDEINSLFYDVILGDLKACIRYVELENQGKKWRNNAVGLFDSVMQYRKVFIEHAANKKGVKPDYEREYSLDVWYHNLKDTIRYLEARTDDPQAEEPNLKVFKGKEILPM